MQEGDQNPVLDHYLPAEELWIYRTDRKTWFVDKPVYLYDSFTFVICIVLVFVGS